jgi:hypothetical protein
VHVGRGGVVLSDAEPIDINRLMPSGDDLIQPRQRISDEP